jgi:hypothetical protein
MKWQIVMLGDVGLTSSRTRKGEPVGRFRGLRRAIVRAQARDRALRLRNPSYFREGTDHGTVGATLTQMMRG